MNITKLSDYKTNNGIKDIWPLEEKNMSPWIAEHLSDIEEIIGKSIDSYELEKRCGRYESDIVATTDDNETVIIENKLGNFDHDHFGKALTYMGGFNAKCIVWICDSYYDEHITAINQLNRMTSDEYTFYALELKPYKINKDTVVYEYNIIAQPDYVIKRINSGKSNQSVNETIVNFYNNIVSRLNQEHIKFTFDKRGNGYGSTQIKTTLDNKVRLYIYTNQRSKSVYCGFENGDEDLYNDIINVIQAKYHDYQFEQLSGVKNKSILRLKCMNKFIWVNDPNEQFDNIIQMFLNLYNTVKNSPNV